jgi:hypothetical protein
MIDMCTAFSSPNEDCSLFGTLFNIESNKVHNVKSALEALRTAAVGVRNLRNKLFHDFLTLGSQYFDNLIACSKQVLQSIRILISCLCGEHRSDYVQQALNEIDVIVKRDSNLSDDERDDLNRIIQQMLEELDQRKSRKFDSFAVCLKNDIREYLTVGVFVSYIFGANFNWHIRKSNRNTRGSGNSLQSLLLGSDSSRQTFPRQQGGGQGTAAGVEFADVVDARKYCSHVLHCL